MTVVTAGDTMRWLHDDGLRRLSGYADSSPQRFSAFTVACADGSIKAFPASGADPISTAADTLPNAADTPGRLVIIGVAEQDSVLVVDMAATLSLAINADDPEALVRAWVAQLLLNPDITINTNDSSADVGLSPRYRHTFIPGGESTMLTINDGLPPVTTVTCNPTSEIDDCLDVTPEGFALLRIGDHAWTLRQVVTLARPAWEQLATILLDDEPSEASDSTDSPLAEPDSHDVDYLASTTDDNPDDVADHSPEPDAEEADHDGTPSANNPDDPALPNTGTPGPVAVATTDPADTPPAVIALSLPDKEKQ